MSVSKFFSSITERLKKLVSADVPSSESVKPNAPAESNSTATTPVATAASNSGAIEKAPMVVPESSASPENVSAETISAPLALEEPFAPVPPYLPDWRKLIANEQTLWDEARKSPRTKIILSTIAGGHPVCMAIESTIAAALTLRGAEVSVLLCDKLLPACLQCAADQFPSTTAYLEGGPQAIMCDYCFSAGQIAFRPLGFKILKLSDFVTTDEIANARARSSVMTLDEISNCVEDDLKVGENAVAGALRFFASGDLATEEQGLEVARKFIESAFIAKTAAKKMIEVGNYDCMLMNHGIYIPHGMVKETAEKNGVRTAIWEMAYRSSCVHFYHNDSITSVLNQPTSLWEDMKWTDECESDLSGYLSTRANGSLDWLAAGMNAGSMTNVGALADEFNIDLSKPTFGLLTNVIWDAVLFYPGNAFPSLVDWLIETIKYFMDRPQFNLIVRIHPGEVKGGMTTRQTAMSEINKVFASLPPNIIIIPPESSANTYTLMGLCDSVIIYGTTTGMELTSVGIPTITAGQAFIKNKGITLDAHSRDEYFALLDKLPLKEKMTGDWLRRARMYTYHHYFRHSIPIASAEPVAGWPPMKMNVNSLKELLPGVDYGLDVICDGILNQADFVYKAEEQKRKLGALSGV